MSDAIATTCPVRASGGGCIAGGCGALFRRHPNLPEYEPPQALHYLGQWSEEDRQTCYYTPQGTQVKGQHYAWFGALEKPFGRDKLTAPECLARFGFLVDPQQQPFPHNPGNLPVGFARHEHASTGFAYLISAAPPATPASCAITARPFVSVSGAAALAGARTRADRSAASQLRPCAVFRENCAHCYETRPPTRRTALAPERDPEWYLPVIPLGGGTEPTTANNIADQRFDLIRLGWTREEPDRLDVRLGGGASAPLVLSKALQRQGAGYITAYVEERAYREAGIEAAERAEFDGLPIGVQKIRGCKAHPLDDIWATPSFLHSGPVANYSNCSHL